MSSYVTTSHGIDLDRDVLLRYMAGLVHRFYKILPLREENEPTLDQYIEGLLRELLGCKALIEFLKDDDRYMSLISMLQYMLVNKPDVATTKSDVFRAINILRQLQKKYGPLKE